MPETIQTRAAMLLAFTGDTPVAQRLTACRQFLKEEMDAQHRRHALLMNSRFWHPDW